MNSYEVLADFYDRFNEHIDYSAWADYVESYFREYGISKGDIVLDAACGTGRMTLELAGRGYDMIGTDISPEMLMQARTSADELGVMPLFLLQDLLKMDLYGTVKAITCCLDSLNYLEDTDELERFFRLAHNYVEPGGLLLFDLNSRYKFEHVYGDNCYVMQDDSVFLAWQNFYDDESMECKFVLDFFIKDGKGQYKRKTEEQYEHCFEHGDVLSLLEKCSFRVIAVNADVDKTPIGDTTERIHYVCQRI